MSRELAVVLASGGMDSAVTTAIANQTCRLALLHLNYGQRTVARELRRGKAQKGSLGNYFEYPEVCRPAEQTGCYQP